MYKINTYKALMISFLTLFVMMQIVSCFTAGFYVGGFVGFLFFLTGGVTCLFGLALNFLLLIIAVDFFSAFFGQLAQNIGKTPEMEDGEEEETLV